MTRRAALLLVTATVLLAYARSFGVPFQFDDLDQIVHNPILRLRTIPTLVNWGRNRIIPYATLIGNFVVGDLDPFGYHLVNLAVHLTSTLLVFFIALALCRTPRMQGSTIARHDVVFALFAALLFGVHPIQVQAVTYVSQRFASMAGMFYLAAVYFYLRHALDRGESSTAAARSSRWMIAAALAGTAAIFSKENAVSLPLALLLVNAVFFGRGSVLDGLRKLPFFLLITLTVPLIWLLVWEHPQLPPATDLRQQLERVWEALRPPGSGSVSAWQYALTQCTVIPRYLGLVLYPAGLNIDHDVPIQTGLSLPVAAGAALLALLLISALLVRRRFPLWAFAVLWLFVTLSVESTFLPITDPMMEHRMYLPMAGICLAIAGALALLADRFGRLPLFTGSVAVTALMVTTIARNEIWRDELTLWLDAQSKSPNKARVHANVGFVLLGRDQAREALPHFCKAAALDPKNGGIQRGLNTAAERELEKILESGSGFERLQFSQDGDGNTMVELKNPCG